ncbi:MAG: O-antigen ligase family protein [Candidatus Delongbacteria bacterium]
MYNRYYLYAYLAFCLPIALHIIFRIKPKHKIINLIITYWFLISPVIRSRLFRDTNPFRFITGRAWRFGWQIAWLFLLLLIMRFLTVKNSKFLSQKKMPVYEKFLYAYLFISIFVTYFHLFVGNIPEIYSFARQFMYYQALLFYFVIVKFIDKDTIKCIFRSSIYMAVFSSFTCTVQFFYNTWFMRSDRVPRAFEGYHRSTGIFPTPQEHVFITAVGIFLIIFMVRNKFIKSGLLILFFQGILLTFSRGSWMAVLMPVMLYLFYMERKLFFKLTGFGILFGLIFFMFFEAYTPDLSKITESDVMEERVMSDTASQRFDFYYYTLQTIWDAWVFGYGDKENNEVYYKWMFIAGGKDWALGHGGGIHNLLLEELFFKGLFSTLSLILFFFSFFLYCHKKALKENNYLYLIPLYFNITFLLYMMTAAAFLSSYGGFMVILFTAIVSAVYHNDIDITEFTIYRQEKKLHPVKHKDLAYSKS